MEHERKHTIHTEVVPFDGTVIEMKWACVVVCFCFVVVFFFLFSVFKLFYM